MLKYWIARYTNKYVATIHKQYKSIIRQIKRTNFNVTYAEILSLVDYEFGGTGLFFDQDTSQQDKLFPLIRDNPKLLKLFIYDLLFSVTYLKAKLEFNEDIEVLEKLYVILQTDTLVDLIHFLTECINMMEALDSKEEYKIMFQPLCFFKYYTRSKSIFQLYDANSKVVRLVMDGIETNDTLAKLLHIVIYHTHTYVLDI